MPEQNYPEHEKLHAVVGMSQPMGEFLDWLKSHGYEIGKWMEFTSMHDNGRTFDFMPVQKGISEWLAEVFEIDLARLDAEKEAILAEIRRAQGIGHE